MNKKALGELNCKGVSEDGKFQAVVSGMKPDRHGDTINQAGWDLKNFKKNPVLLWGHDHSIPAIGKANKVWVENDELLMEGEFAPTTFAQEIKSLVEGGFLKAFSVGFSPVEYSLNESGVDFLKQELLEVSFVNVPAYASALMKGIDKLECKEVKTFMEKSAKENTSKNDVVDEIKTEDPKIIDARENKSEEGISVPFVEVIFTEKEFAEFKKSLEIKSGRVLSDKNKTLLQNAIDAMKGAIAPLEELLTSVEDSKTLEDSSTAKGYEIAEYAKALQKELKPVAKIVSGILSDLKKPINN